jgi:hypothetical protein
MAARLKARGVVCGGESFLVIFVVDAGALTHPLAIDYLGTVALKDT